jgi:hypothetical protein
MIHSVIESITTGDVTRTDVYTQTYQNAMTGGAIATASGTAGRRLAIEPHSGLGIAWERVVDHAVRADGR